MLVASTGVILGTTAIPASSFSLILSPSVLSSNNPNQRSLHEDLFFGVVSDSNVVGTFGVDDLMTSKTDMGVPRYFPVLLLMILSAVPFEFGVCAGCSAFERVQGAPAPGRDSGCYFSTGRGCHSDGGGRVHYPTTFLTRKHSASGSFQGAGIGVWRGDP